MVDAAQLFAPMGGRADRMAASTRASSTVTVSAVSTDTLGVYAKLCQTGVYAPPQSALWIETWIGQATPDAFIAIIAAEGRPVFALPLEVTRQGPFKIAGLMSGRHANGNFPASDPNWLHSAKASDMRSLLGAIHAARPDIDIVALERLLPDLDGTPNPLATLPRFSSPNISLAVDLEGGFDALLLRSSGKRKRKKHRAQTRKFESAGPLRRIEGRTPEEVAYLFDAFLAMKEQRFRKMGIANVFGEAEVRAFFRTLFIRALKESPPPFVLHGLEVAGKLRAVTGSSRSDKRLICEFGAIVEDELAGASPGEFLFFDNIQEACEAGLSVYDFSVGDEAYKRVWCDIETRHFDVVMPLTIKGRAMAASMRGFASFKSFVKNSPVIWKLVKMLRRKAAGKTEPIED